MQEWVRNNKITRRELITLVLRLTPYLMMDGNARDAIKFYEQALNAKTLSIQTYGEMPQNPNMSVPAHLNERVAHAMLKVGEADLMISDLPEQPGQPNTACNRVNTCITTNSVDTAKQIFEALQQGGQVNCPFGETHFSPAFGVVTDRFGVTFTIVTEA